jgi:transposase-like protein
MQKAAARKRPTPHRKPTARRRRGRYSNADRARILAAAQKGGLTALQVQAKFGVKPVTYYLWRKKAKAGGRPGRRGASPRGSKQDAIVGMVRANVQERLQALLPEIVRSEVAEYLERAFKKGR